MTALSMALVLSFTSGTGFAAVPGTVINNTATSSYSISGVPGFGGPSNIATVTVGLTPAAIGFYQYSPTAVGTFETTSPSSCANGSAVGPFIPSTTNPAYLPGATTIDTSVPVNLVTTSNYLLGEPIFVRLQDLNRNIDPAVRDTVRVNLTNAGTGDAEVVEMSETDINTGIFFGYLPSATGAATSYNCQFEVTSNNSISVSYVDSYDGTDIASVSAVVAPTSGPTLFVTKSASKDRLAIGDFIKYRVNVNNTDIVTSVGTIINDVLPVGFRYRAGSAKLGASTLADPVIAANGRNLQFAVGDVASAADVTLTYVAEVTSGAPLGTATNIVSATNTVSASSNEARASVKVGDDLFRHETHVMGRVTSGTCEATDVVEGEAALRLQSSLSGDLITYTLSLSGAKVPVDKLNVTVELPEAMSYVVDSAQMLEGKTMYTYQQKNAVRFDLGDRQGDWLQVIQFKARALQGDVGVYPVRAVATFNTPLSRDVKLVAENTLQRQISRMEIESYVALPKFDKSSTRLDDGDKSELDDLIRQLKGQKIEHIRVSGHTDAVTLGAGGKAQYNDNHALSLARAKSVGTYLQQQMGLSKDVLVYEGYGPDRPVAGNNTPAGREKNRRVEIEVTSVQQQPDMRFSLLRQDSGPQGTTTKGMGSTHTHGQNTDGVAGVRLLLENGTYVVTDQYGRYHFQGLKPGTHVIQLDPATIPDGYEPYYCENNTQIAGSANSRFVDLKGGTLWRTDFFLRPTTMRKGDASVQMHSSMDGDYVDMTLTIKGSEHDYRDRQLIIRLPESLRYVAGSSVMDGGAVADPTIQNGQLSYRLGDRSGRAWHQELRLRARYSEGKDSELPIQSLFKVRVNGQEYSTPVVDNTLFRFESEVRYTSYLFRPKFEPLSVNLGEADKQQLRQLLAKAQGRDIDKIRVVGHSDNTPLSSAGRRQFKDNTDLSRARAQEVAKLAKSILGLEDRQIEVIGMGSGAPIASNATEEGRDSNRRVEIFVGTKDPKAPRILKLVQNDKSPRFGTREYRLSEEDKERVQAVIKRLREQTVTRLKVVGHSDSRALTNSETEIKDNYELSRARAASMAQYLKTTLGLSDDKIEIVGMGPAQPIADNSTEEGRNLNRRVEIHVSLAEEDPYRALKLLRDDSGEQLVRISVGSLPTLSPVSETTQSTTLPTQENAEVFEPAWVEQVGPGLEWLAPQQGINPRIPVVRIAIKHNVGDKVRLALNGKEVSPLNYDGVNTNKAKTVAISYWRGVDIEEGDNVFQAIVFSKDGAVVGKTSYQVHYSGSPVKAELVPDKSILLADGKNPVVLAIRLRDKEGYPVRAGVSGRFSVAAPYTAKQATDHKKSDPLGGLDQSFTLYKINNDEGIAYIELDPTTQAGKATVNFTFNRSEQEIRAWLKPAKRDWVLVGLAEGTAGYNTVSGNMQAAQSHDIDNELYTDGRLAFYAKGSVKGEWLITAAYDSAKEQPVNDRKIYQVIDPDEYYTLYGDATNQAYDAQSAKKLYVKLEREQFYALFGDYNTDLTVTELSRYSRTMTGLKTEFENDHYVVSAFAAETNQVFKKDEIRGDGTSGLYRLSHRNIVINSDKITIETRDRFHSHVVLESRTLSRHVDYNIDSAEGTIYFKEPIYAQDSNFNPIYIVVEYEAIDAAGSAITAGGRAALKSAGGKVVTGVTAVHEGNVGAKGDLAGVDVTYQVTDQTQVRAEIANTEKEDTGSVRSGSAYLAEVIHQGTRLTSKAYVREQQEGFGLDQQKASEEGTQKMGADASYKMSDRVTVKGEVWHENNLTTEATRDVANTSVEYRQHNYSLSAGLRHAQDQDSLGVDKTSDLVTAGATRGVLDNRMNLRANTEVAVGDEANPDFPSRLVLGADYRIFNSGRLFLEQEYTEGENQDSETTRAGIASPLWQGATMHSSVENQMNDTGPRTFANMGLYQTVNVSERLGLSFGLDRVKTLRHPGDSPFNDSVPPSSGTLDNDYTAYSAGATYRETLWSGTTRFERRVAELENKDAILAGVYRQHTPGLGVSALVQHFTLERADTTQDTESDVRLSLAYRPLISQWVLLNRLDLIRDESITLADTYLSRKIVDNFNANYRWNHRNQLSLQLGLKKVTDTFDGVSYSGTTQLYGTEYRYDINERWDYGLHASTLQSNEAGNHLYSWGMSVGFSPVKNLWLTGGYNVDGFEDSDFTAAGYTAKGPYIKFRYSFDYQAARGFMAWWEKGRGDMSSPAQ